MGLITLKEIHKGFGGKGKEVQVLKGIDKQLEGKELGTYTLDIQTDDAFGKKKSKTAQNGSK